MNILVTGASQGIGSEVVKEFAKNTNNHVVAISRNLSALEKLKAFCHKEYANNNIHVYSIDYLSETFKKEFDSIIDKHQDHFDVVINNAGFLINEAFAEVSLNKIKDLYQVNVFAPIEIIQSLLQKNIVKTKIAHIVNIGSMGGYQGSVKFPGLSIYSSSKSALANLTECLAEEYKNQNVKFNCLALGSVQTEMLSKAFPEYKAQVSAKEMAKYIVDFSVSGSIYFNGKIIPISKDTP